MLFLGYLLASRHLWPESQRPRWIEYLMYPANLHDAGSLSEWLGIEAFLPLLGDRYRRSHS